MKNINKHGKKHLQKYLNDYAAGLISFAAVCLYVGTCFTERK